ncbi:MAG: aspartate-semialdehyde dehydrogenase [Phycisphaeraceae bacterium]|nr:aspartate-semialdehyde dehydrogenase [Phycisphaeraceae bacterium]
MIPSDCPIVVVGATGAVGREALSILESRNHPAKQIRAVASARSAGSSIPYSGGNLTVTEAGPASFAGSRVALFCATSDTARALAPIARAAGCAVVDNSSAFRADPGVPLVVPEVNGEEVVRASQPALVANPNCSTILMLVALEPIRRRFGIERIVVSTYQAVSGAGAAAIVELQTQAADMLAGRAPQAKVFAEPCAFNVFSHNSTMDEATGLNGEEKKMIGETRRIWNDPDVEVSPMCVRVPVIRAHSESVAVTLSSPASEGEVRAAFEGARGVCLIDDRKANKFPTPLQASGTDTVFVGRLRADPGSNRDAQGRTRHHCLFLSGDQLRKGAALNAIQIADLLFRK